MRLSVVHLGPLAVALAAITACHEELIGPEALLNGAYFLTSVDGARLPAPIWEEGGVTFRLVSEILTFDGRGQVTRAFSWRRDSVGGAPISAGAQTATLQYRVTLNSVAIGSFDPCPSNAAYTSDCVPNEHGVFDITGLVLVSPFYQGRTLRYGTGGVDN